MKITSSLTALCAATIIATLLTGCGGSKNDNNVRTPNVLNPDPPPAKQCKVHVSGATTLAIFYGDLSTCTVEALDGAQVVFDDRADPIAASCDLQVEDKSITGLRGNCGSYRITSIPQEGELRPANLLSPQADKLSQCIFEYPEIEDSEQWVDYVESNLCLLSDAPLVGEDNSDISVAAILEHTQVSHPWMTERFTQLLEVMPQELLNLFRGVTGVVIGANIRPSYYWQATGAIYLDPADLWLTTNERNSISRAEDPRSGYTSQLQFNSFWEYFKDGDFAWEYFPLDGSNGNSRTLDDILLPMAALLFHELAHANDNIPPRRLSSVDNNQLFIDLLISLESVSASAQMDQTYPLQSQLLIDLTEVSSFGAAPSAEQIALTAEDIGHEFAPDGANDLYAYSLYYENDDYRIFSEDIAMLFEEVMMKHHFDVDRMVAFTDTGASFDDYMMRWGRINRAGNDYVRVRAELIINTLLGVDDAHTYLQRMPAPTSLKTGVSLGESLLDYLNSQAGLQKTQVQPQALTVRQPRQHALMRDHQLRERIRQKR